MEFFHLDYETKAVPDLDEVGVDVYSADPSAEVILAQYARGDRKVQCGNLTSNPRCLLS